jgi:hypothetical protein
VTPPEQKTIESTELQEILSLAEAAESKMQKFAQLADAFTQKWNRNSDGENYSSNRNGI